MELDETSFLDSRRFRLLRYFVATCVVCFYFGKLFYNIVIEAYYVSQNGPSARSATFVFGLDDLIVALIPIAVLISELRIVTKPKTYHLLRTVCIIVGLIAMISGFLFLREIVNLLDYCCFEIGIAAYILRQVSIVLAAIYLYHCITIRESETDIINA